jgi:hypothetical protein
MVKTEKRRRKRRRKVKKEVLAGENRKEEEEEEDEAAFECKKSPKKIIYSYWPKLASQPEFVEIDRNGRNSPEWVGIFSEVE